MILWEPGSQGPREFSILALVVTIQPKLPDYNLLWTQPTYILKDVEMARVTSCQPSLVQRIEIL